jgi:hypothetical protein
MTTPDFNDLTPPDWMVKVWSLNATNLPTATLAYRAGASHGYEQARQLWPEPITDRPPTEADGDADGVVQVFIADGQYWSASHWSVTVESGRPWLHTPRWQPRQPSLQEQIREANIALDWIGKHYIGNEAPERFRTIRRALSRALEQAGEGVE